MVALYSADSAYFSVLGVPILWWFYSLYLYRVISQVLPASFACELLWQSKHLNIKRLCEGRQSAQVR
jgi:hypothetical protein